MPRGAGAPDDNEREGARLTVAPILATDAQERAVVAVIRCLTELGFPVGAVGTGRLAPGLWSRTVRHRYVAADPTEDTLGFVERLAEILASGTYRVLLPGTDASLLAVSEHRARLDGLVELPLPDHETVMHCLDRARLSEAAAKVGLDSPEQRICATPQEAVASAAAFGYPVIVKPLSTVVSRGTGMWRRASRAAADQETVHRRAEELGDCIVQRKVEGPVISFGGVASRTGLVAGAVSRYERTWPAAGGNVSFSQTVTVPPGLADSVGELLLALGWFGLFELELVEQPGGRFAAIDFNPRAYGSLSLAAAAGQPLSAIWCRMVLEDRLDAAAPASMASARPGVSYRWGEADFSNAITRWRAGERGALAALGPRRGVVHPYFRRDDPLPVVARAAGLIGKRL